MEKIRFVSLTLDSGTKTYVRADAIMQLMEESGKTFVFIANDKLPIAVKESVSECLAKIGGDIYENVQESAQNIAKYLEEKGGESWSEYCRRLLRGDTSK